MKDDVISRQAAIKDAESWVAVDEYEKHLQKSVVEWLKEFPSAPLDAPDTNVGDMISRQAAVTEIAKFMLEYGGENEKRERDALHRAAKGIKALSSAQPEEIVMCKDCKHYKASDYTGRLACHYVIGCTVIRNLDDFCSRAERREE